MTIVMDEPTADSSVYETEVRSQSFSNFARVGAIVCLSCFALSGTLKEFPLLTAVPFDLTQLTGLGAFALGMVYRFDDRSLPSRTQFVMLAMFLTIVLLGSVGGLDTEYGSLKATKALQVTFLGVLCASLAVKDREDLKLFLTTFFVTGFVVGLPLAAGMDGYRDQFGRFTTEGGSTINLGQAAGSVVFALAAYFLVRRDRLTVAQAGGMAVIGGISAFVMLGVGSRGPLQGLVVAVAFAAIASLQTATPGAGRRFATLVAAGIALVFAVWSSTPESSRERIAEFSGNSTADTRVLLWETTWRELDFDLFGSGFGSWEQFGGVDDYTYPHNMFLEFWFETGLIGMTLAIIYFSTPVISRWYSLKSDPLLGLLAAGLVIYYWTGAMVSGDFNDHRALWLLAMVAAAPIARRESPRRSFETTDYELDLSSSMAENDYED